MYHKKFIRLLIILKSDYIMSQNSDVKNIIVDIRDLSFKSEQHVEDLTRYLAEALPKIEINREGYELDIIAPINLSKRAIRLRIRKFSYRKGLNVDFRPISLNNTDKDGYSVKEKRVVEFSYY